MPALYNKFSKSRPKAYRYGLEGHRKADGRDDHFGTGSSDTLATSKINCWAVFYKMSHRGYIHKGLDYQKSETTTFRSLI